MAKEVCTLDTAGRKVQRIVFNSSNKPEGYLIYNYNLRRNNTATNYYSPDSVLMPKYNYEYDSLGNITLSQFYNTGHYTTIAARIIYIYDDYQNWTDKDHYTPGKRVRITKQELGYY